MKATAQMGGLTRQEVERFYVEVTNPDELGLTDSRFKIVFDLALQAIDRLGQDAIDAQRYRKRCHAEWMQLNRGLKEGTTPAEPHKRSYDAHSDSLPPPPERP